jgi:4-amino-4-deoxy-L-arabinose transferase-like glycosyltransferase
MAAAGPFLDGARPTGLANRNQEGVELLYQGGQPERRLVLMRLGILPFFFLAAGVVFLWARHHFGGAAAVLATALFTLTPPVLAHAGLGTTDMPLTACLGAAFLALLWWAERPSFPRAVLLGLATGMAVLSKFTTLGFFPAAALVALVFYIATQRPGAKRLVALARERALSFPLAVLTGALVIWAGYWFSFGSVPAWNVRLPAPELFAGVSAALRHTGRGHTAYLFGEVSQAGWWYYSPVALAVKTPLAFLALLSFGSCLAWKRRARGVYTAPAAFALGVLLPSMAGNVNIGVRHVLPVYIGFAIIGGLGLLRLLEWAETRKWASWTAATLLGWIAVSGAVHHPSYLAYFNALAGDEPEKVLVDSDLDWGQDTKRLANRLRELGANEVSFVAMDVPPGKLEVWPGLPVVRPIAPFTPLARWTAVGPTAWKLMRFNGGTQPLWFERLKPRERVGALLLYYVP